MTLVLHEHPFAAYCWKALIAFYECDVPLRARVRRRRRGSRAAGRAVAGRQHPRAGRRRPRAGRVDGDRRARHARACPGGRRADVGSRDRRPGDDADAEDRRRQPAARGLAGPVRRRRGPRHARPRLRAARRPPRRRTGSPARRSRVADCAAAPALFYANVVHRWDEAAHPALTAYFERLTARPSVARVIDEARPYREIFPLAWPAHVT